MDVRNLNGSNQNTKTKLKKSISTVNKSKFSMENYFTWFSALIFTTELVVGKWTIVEYINVLLALFTIDANWQVLSFVTKSSFLRSLMFCCVSDFWVGFYYFNANQVPWGICTVTIIVVPLILCQMYSMWLLKINNKITAPAICMHLVLLGIPYRYVVGLQINCASTEVLHKVGGFRYRNILRTIDKDKANNQEMNTIGKAIYNVNSVQTLNAIFQYCPQFLLQTYLIVYRDNKCVLTGKNTLI